MSTLTLDYAANQVMPPLEPTPDDQQTANQITARRVDGGEVQQTAETGPLSVQEPPDGVGVYDRQIVVDIEDDDGLSDVAGWALHIGTWDEDRYPVIRTNIRQLSTESAALVSGALDLDVIDNGRIQIENPPDWMPAETIDQYVLGYRESISVSEWTQDWHTAPAGPYAVFVLGDDVLGRLDTAGSSLGGGIDDDDTSLIVATDSGKRPWINSTDHSGDFPFKVKVGGEVVEVTAISGSSSPQTFTVTRGVNGITRAWPAGTQVRLFRTVAVT